MPGPARGPLWMSILGRSLTIVALTGLGLLAGLVVGGLRAARHVAALPPLPAKPTLGMESAGLTPAVVIAVDLVIGAVVGAGAAALVGIVWAIFWPRQRLR